MNTLRRLAALCAVFLLALSFSTLVHAGGGDESPQSLAETETMPEVGPNPFTSAGTGTVIDNATNEDEKEFYTITTPNEHVFYLVIDKQREQDNVYFLNAVTEKDLLALAEKSGDAADSENPLSTPQPEPTPDVTLEPIPEPEPAPKSNTGMLLLVLAVIVIGGGAGYYFKIYRPKQEQADYADQDYDEYEEEPYPIPEEETPSWETDDENLEREDEDK